MDDNDLLDKQDKLLESYEEQNKSLSDSLALAITYLDIYHKKLDPLISYLQNNKHVNLSHNELFNIITDSIEKYYKEHKNLDSDH